MSTPVYGVEQRALVKSEATFDTIAAFTTSHGIGYSKLTITPKFEHKAYVEHVGTASLQGEHPAKHGGDWEIECYAKAAGVATEPQHAPFIQAAGFTFGSPTSGKYGLNTSQPTSLQIARKTGASLYEIISGAWVSMVEWEAKGADAAIFRAKGGFASYGGLFGVAVTAASAYLSGVTSIALAAAHAYKVLPGARVAFGAEDNTAAGYLVTAVSTDGLTLTISPALASGIDASQTLTAVIPAATISGTVIGGTSDGLSIDSAAVGFISGKITVETGIHGLDKESSANRPNRLARGARTVKFEGSSYFLDETAHVIGGAHSSKVRALALRLGANTAGVRTIITLPTVRLDVTPIEVPDAEEATYKISGLARQNAAAEDEITIDTN